jgi:hypothetical protein
LDYGIGDTFVSGDGQNLLATADPQGQQDRNRFSGNSDDTKLSTTPSSNCAGVAILA